MRIKHWQGYGTVNAKKLNCRIVDNKTEITIRVTGNHEYGVRRNDRYDVTRWLLSKFDKKMTDYRSITSMTLEEGTTDVDGIETDYCDYHITYRNA